MSMKLLPASSRPRERLLAHGAAALADAELLALLLRTGLRGVGVVEYAASLLERFGGFAGLLHAPPRQLAGVRGLGPARRAELAAVGEMVRRALAQRLADAPTLGDPDAVRAYVALHLRPADAESFAVLFLDNQHRLVTMETLFRGTLARTVVHPREVVRRAMALNAAAVILAHNHPSGLAEPSRADELLTQQLAAALALVDVRVLDHLIVAGPSVVSMAERGLV